MNLVRCRDQKRCTLDEFYLELCEGEEVSQEIGRTMLGLLKRLRALPDARQVWGLTSHYHLCLLAEDEWKSAWYVMVIGRTPQSYLIEYRLPEEQAPWPNAHVRGEAASEDEAVGMILVAMEKSGGWNSPA